MLLQALAEIAQLKLEKTKLQAENAELRRRLGMNSSNSHMQSNVRYVVASFQ